MDTPNKINEPRAEKRAKKVKYEVILNPGTEKEKKVFLYYENVDQAVAFIDKHYKAKSFNLTVK
jgi:hypothetical protein